MCSVDFRTLFVKTLTATFAMSFADMNAILPFPVAEYILLSFLIDKSCHSPGNEKLSKIDVSLKDELKIEMS